MAQERAERFLVLMLTPAMIHRWQSCWHGTIGGVAKISTEAHRKMPGTNFGPPDSRDCERDQRMVRGMRAPDFKNP